MSELPIQSLTNCLLTKLTLTPYLWWQIFFMCMAQAFLRWRCARVLRFSVPFTSSIHKKIWMISQLINYIYIYIYIFSFWDRKFYTIYPHVKESVKIFRMIRFGIRKSWEKENGWKRQLPCLVFNQGERKLKQSEECPSSPSPHQS